MKPKAALFITMVIIFVAAISFYIGGSMRGTNSDQQFTPSAILPIVPKPAKAEETNLELAHAKWEYGVYTTIKGVGDKWQDSDKTVFSVDKKEFNRKIGLSSDALLQDLLNLLGTQGWKLVSVSSEGTQEEPAFICSYYFKRPK